MNEDVNAAYAVCRTIARREAKNFYFSFIALPPHKRNAMCAVYAFMRHADDLSDDESKPHAQRRQELAAWMGQWRAASGGEATGDPVFIALRDTCRRFAIPDALLEQLVQGTAMDLETERPTVDGPLQTYSTFGDLYRYCYFVASVVGLVCIHIFGYTDLRAEKLAEETGIAFQLTNILRDVREDAERGRVYLPLEDLRAHDVTPEEFTALRRGAAMTAGQRAVLAATADRARTYYLSARELMPLIAADSRPALWVLVTIYARLLRRIEHRNYDVFSSRVRVPTLQKLTILARGLLRMSVSRLAV